MSQENPNKYKRQEEYAKRKGIVKRGYSIHKDIADDFAESCKRKGVSIGPQLEKLMQKFIDEE